MTIYTEKDKLYEKAIKWLKENEDEANDYIEELDSWNGYLDEDRYFSMDDFNELLDGKTPLEIAALLDDDFNVCDDYFQWTIYGIKSFDYKDYTGHFDKYFIDELIENSAHLYTRGFDDEFIEILLEIENYGKEESNE